jgi:hypothetical protein
VSRSQSLSLDTQCEKRRRCSGPTWHSACRLTARRECAAPTMRTAVAHAPRVLFTPPGHSAGTCPQSPFCVELLSALLLPRSASCLTLSPHCHGLHRRSVSVTCSAVGAPSVGVQHSLLTLHLTDNTTLTLPCSADRLLVRSRGVCS